MTFELLFVIIYLDMNKYRKISKAEILTIIAFVLIGAGLILYAVFYYYRAENYLKNYVQTEGVIVDIRVDYGTDESMWYIYVEYEVDNVVYVNTMGNTVNFLNEMEIGRTVPIRYMRDNPNRIIYDKELFTPFWVLLSLGIISFCGSIFGLSQILIKLRKKNIAKA